MKRIIIFGFCLTIIFLYGCRLDSAENNGEQPSPAFETEQKNDAQIEKKPPGVETGPPISSAYIKSGDEIYIKRGLLSDFIDLDKSHYIGYDLEGGLIFRNYDDFILRRVNIETGETSDIMDISSGKGHYIMAEMCSGDWIVWSESFDKALYVGTSTGDDWAIYAANIKTKELITIDAEDDTFPKDRNVNVQPIGMSVKGDIFAYLGFVVKDGEILAAIKVFDFRTRKLEVLAVQDSSGMGFSDPSVGDDCVVFGKSEYSDGYLINNKIYLYDTKHKTLSEIENSHDAALPVTSGNFIAATIRKNIEKADRILIYDIERKRWIREINGSEAIYKDRVYPFHATDLQMHRDYLVWNGVMNHSFYAYVIPNDIFFELLSPEEGRVHGSIFHFNSNFLAWYDSLADLTEGRTSFVILG